MAVMTTAPPMKSRGGDGHNNGSNDLVGVQCLSDGFRSVVATSHVGDDSCQCSAVNGEECRGCEGSIGDGVLVC